MAALGDSESARELGVDTLQRLTELLGVDHPLTLAAAANLVFDLRAEGEADEAEQLSQATMDRFARTLGLGHPDPQAFLAGRRLDFDFDAPPI
jgi:MoxR-like ATPase